MFDDPAQLLDEQLDYQRITPEPRHVLELAGRTIAVMAEVLKNVAEESSVKKVATWVSRVGLIVTLVAKILVPNSLHGLLYKHWITIAFIAVSALGIAAFIDGDLLSPFIHVAVPVVCVWGAMSLTRLAVNTAVPTWIRTALIATALGAAVFASLTISAYWSSSSQSGAGVLQVKVQNGGESVTVTPAERHASAAPLSSSNPSSLQKILTPLGGKLSPQQQGLSWMLGFALVMSVAWSKITTKGLSGAWILRIGTKRVSWPAWARFVLQVALNLLSLVWFALLWWAWDQALQQPQILNVIPAQHPHVGYVLAILTAAITFFGCLFLVI